MIRFNAVKPAHIAAIIATLFVNSSQASEREDLETLRQTTLTLIEVLVEQGVLPQVKAEAMMQEASRRTKEKLASQPAVETVEAAPVAAGTVRVPYVPQMVKDEIRAQIKDEVLAQAKTERWGEPGALPDWLERIKWEGDLRLRYEKDLFPSGNPLPGVNFLADRYNVSNTTKDRERWRVRARLGAQLKLNENWAGEVRMTTGSADDPVSPNQTLANYTGKYSFALDRLALKYQPKPWLSVTGGRIANPWFHTDLVWDPDLSFDGVAVAFKQKLSDRLDGFATVGAFPIQEVESSNTVLATDKWLYGAQAGIQWAATQNVNLKVAAAFYDFENIEGHANPATGVNPGPYDKSVPVFRQKGNSVFDINQSNSQVNGSVPSLYALASSFREVNLTGQLDLAHFAPVHVILTGDYVKNIAYDEAEILARTGFNYSSDDTAYQMRLAVGMLDTLKANNWQVFAAYKRLGADSVVDAFTDSDFHLGGTNAKGWLVGGSYGVDKNAWITARYFSADEVNGVSGSSAISGLPLAVDVLMLDLNAKF